MGWVYGRVGLSTTMDSATSTVKLDSKGRVVIPSTVRDSLGIGDGDVVEIEVRA